VLRLLRNKRGAEVTDSTVNRALAGLRRLFNFAIAREYMEETPFPKTSKSGLLYPEPRGKKKYFTEQQIERILEEAFKPEYPCWMRDVILTRITRG